MCLTSAVWAARSCVTSSSTSFGTKFDNLEPTYDVTSLVYLLSGKLVPDEIVRWRIGSERGVVITVVTVGTVGGVRVARILTFLTAFFQRRLPAVLTGGGERGLSGPKSVSIGELTGGGGGNGDVGGENSVAIVGVVPGALCLLGETGSFGSALNVTGEVVGRTLASKSSSSLETVRQDLIRVNT